MYPAAFEYIAPRDLKEALDLANRYGEAAKFLAGGQSLVPLMKLRLARPAYLIDLNRVPDLSFIREENGAIVCGAMTRHFECEESTLLKNKIPMIPQAAAHIGDAQVRNRGTIGGSLAEADPAGDWGPVVLALNATLKCAGLGGERVLEAKDFFDFAYSTKLEPNEVLTEIHFPIPSRESKGVYSKLERVAGDFAIVSVALQMTMDESGVCRELGIGLGGVGVAPLKPASAETFLLGKKIAPEVLEQACEMFDSEVDPLSDRRGSADYKRRVLKVVFKRAVAGLLAASHATARVDGG